MGSDACGVFPLKGSAESLRREPWIGTRKLFLNFFRLDFLDFLKEKMMFAPKSLDVPEQNHWTVIPCLEQQVERQCIEFLCGTSQGWGQGYRDIWAHDVPGTSCPQQIVFRLILRFDWKPQPPPRVEWTGGKSVRKTKVGRAYCSGVRTQRSS